jgi:hypothetical protein
MKNIRMVAIAVGLTTIAILAADASAYYHPTIGRFISRDPGAGRSATRPTATANFPPRDPTGSKQYADGMNLYEYVRSRPTIATDPSGTTLVIHCKARKVIENSLKDEGVTGYRRSQVAVKSGGGIGVQDTQAARKEYDSYSGKPKYQSARLDSEIIGTMIRSPRVFRIKGSTATEALRNLHNHARVRKNAIRAAKNFRAEFGDYDFNDKFWDSSKGIPTPKPGMMYDAYEDICNNSSGYTMRCRAGAASNATWAAMQVRGREWTNKNVMGNIETSYHLFYRRSEKALPKWDWIPGDVGEINNPAKKPPLGLEGQNLIYVGNNNWFGHTGGDPRFLDIDGWLKWFRKKAPRSTLNSRRLYPKEGLTRD